MSEPEIRNVTVECGQTENINAFDANGAPVTYRVIARSLVGATPGTTPDQEHDGGFIIPPAHTAGMPKFPGSIIANVNVAREDMGASPANCSIDLVLDPTVFPDVPTGNWRSAAVWHVDEQHLAAALDLPAGPQERSGVMLFLGLDRQ